MSRQCQIAEQVSECFLSLSILNLLWLTGSVYPLLVPGPHFGQHCSHERESFPFTARRGGGRKLCFRHLLQWAFPWDVFNGKGWAITWWVYV